MNKSSRQLPASIKKLVIPCIGVIALVLFSWAVIYETTKLTVTVTSNDEEQTVRTHAKTIKELLEELEIEIGEYDDLSPNADTALEDDMEVFHKEAKQIYLTIDDEIQEFYTTEDSVGAFLEAEHLTFSEHDLISFHEDDQIVDGLTLQVTTADQVTINDGGDLTKVWTTVDFVADVLKEYDIQLNDLDKIKPKLNERITEDMAIEITRVEKEIDEVEEKIAFSVEKREDNTLEKGKEKIIQEGKEGLLVKKYEITKENGEPVERELVDEEVKEEAQNKIVAVGTKAPKQNLVTLAHENQGTNESSNQNGKVLTMTASAYSAVDCKGCDGRGITATGIDLKANPDMKVISVDPNVIPLGTKVWVEGYGNAIAGDTGGAIKGNRIDVHVPTHADAVRFGVKKVQVKILE